ncbi:MAG TPA: hypothetical protein VMO26_27405, partial [Vicinamibacterales bacterium]|nr:hypothetical protein [Vicinamibacterales bacterium]
MKATQPNRLLLLAVPAMLVSAWSLAVSANPAVVITDPTSASTYTSTTPSLTLAGAAVSRLAVTRVSWRCETCLPTSGSAMGAPFQGDWFFRVDMLRPGANTITVTAEDADGRTGEDVIVVTYTPSDRSSPIVTITGDAARNHRVATGVIDLTGVCSDNVGCTEIAWSPGAGAGGACTGGPRWRCSGVVLRPGANVLTITGRDAAGNTGADTVSVTYDQPLAITPASRVSAADRDGPQEGPHAYFDRLKALPEVYPIADCRRTLPGDNGACSFRSQEQLDVLTNAQGPNLNPNGFVYRYGSDPADDPQDAAKLELTPCPNGCTAGSGSIPNNQVVGIPLGGLNTGTLLIVWDAWFGAEWRPASCGGSIGGQNNMKTFQIRGGSSERGQIYFETRHRFASAVSCDDFAAHDNRVYPAASRTNFPSGVEDDAPYTPTGKNSEPPNTYPLKHSTWTRYIAYLELTKAGSDETFADWRNTYLDQAPTVAAQNLPTAADEVTHPDTWHAFTMWICDEGRDCTRVLWRVPWKLQDGNGRRRNLTEFALGFNTSARPDVRTGNVTAYVRNWVALRNY